MAKSMPTTITRTDLPPFASRMRQAADPVWEEGYRQPFIQELGAGTLDRSKFAFYLMQDELYLGAYAKVHALAVTKTDGGRLPHLWGDTGSVSPTVPPSMTVART